MMGFQVNFPSITKYKSIFEQLHYMPCLACKMLELALNFDLQEWSLLISCSVRLSPKVDNIGTIFFDKVVNFEVEEE
jgi:hypothetical protein